MNKNLSKILITTAVLSVCTTASYAESLFRTGVSQEMYNTQPRSLFNTVRAKSIGDVITVVIEENSTTSNEVKLSIANSSSAQDAFTPVLNNLFRTDKFKSLNGYGGGTTTGNQAKITRTSKSADTITAQVVQVLPNGNLVIQGKKTSVNSGERSEFLLSGILDPRFIDNSGTVSSKNIANLQFALVGKGTVSSSEAEGMVNKFMKFMF